MGARDRKRVRVFSAAEGGTGTGRVLSCVGGKGVWGAIVSSMVCQSVPGGENGSRQLARSLLRDLELAEIIDDLIM